MNDTPADSLIREILALRELPVSALRERYLAVFGEEILFLELPPGAQPLSERGPREAVLGTIDWQEQRRRWEGLSREISSAT